MQAPERIWLHPITEDAFQDAWFEDGEEGDVEYVPAAALSEAQATIARQQVMLDRELEDAGDKMVEIARLRGKLAEWRAAGILAEAQLRQHGSDGCASGLLDLLSAPALEAQHG